MPNWTTNHLYVYGERETLNKLIEFVHGCVSPEGESSVFDFDKIIPYPEPYRSMDANSAPNHWDGFNNGGYKWCCNNWGTKWNAVDPVLDELSERAIRFRFDTAWVRPDPVINALAKMYPTLIFKMRSEYEEERGYWYTQVWNSDKDGEDDNDE